MRDEFADRVDGATSVDARPNVVVRETVLLGETAPGAIDGGERIDEGPVEVEEQTLSDQDHGG